MGDSEDEAASGRTPTEVLAFLIADVRGYTLFTQERGDEAAAKLAAKFARLAREAVDARGGSVIELRGDEALAVFASPRQAIRAAVDLQDRFVEETLADSSLPLTVGIGLDAGEAVPVEGGYRGGALNQAARLCGLAGAGEILASREIVHLARRVDGVAYADGGDVHLKGLSEPVRVMRVSSEAGDAAARLAPVIADRAPPTARAGGEATEAPARRRTGRRLAIAGVLLAVLAAAIAVPVVLAHRGTPALQAIPPDSVGRIDPANGHIVGATPLGRAAGAVAQGEGAVWVVNPDDAMVTRIDPMTGAITDTIAIGGNPEGIAVGHHAVWVVDSAGPFVDRISPDTNSRVAQYPVGNGPIGVAVAFDSVWVTNRLDGTVTRIDQSTGSKQATILVGDAPTGIAASADGVWVANSGSGTAVEIDPSSNAVDHSVNVGNGPGAVAVGPGGVWVANTLDDTVTRIDPATTAAAATIPVGLGPSSVAFTGGTAWVANQFGGTVSRIDTRTSAVTQSIRTSSAPLGAAAVGGRLWLTVRGTATSHRGGTLRVVGGGNFHPSLDPTTYLVSTWRVLILTNDGLVAFKRVGGEAGAEVVPDLATSLPTPTDGGRTYSFQLRPGLRYSTGMPVRASDILRAFERGYRVENGDQPGNPSIPDYYDVIRGGTACRAHWPKPCDLGAGLEADDAAGTVVFHLTQPDAEFLDKLALPFAVALPPGVPMSGEVTDPIPATGPYMISSYVARSGLTLVRNPRFRQWSAAAQPDGFPDRIEYRWGLSPAEQVRAVQEDRADWMDGDPPVAELPILTTQFAARIHPFQNKQTFYLALNTTKAPFDDIRVRKAVQYAIDRKAALDLYGGPEKGRITCQFLPPNFPGYVPYCPYTVDPNPGGQWSAPDLARAKALVAASGTAGQRVEVWAAPYAIQWGRSTVGLLHRLGYRAVLKNEPNRYFALAYPPGPGVQAALDGWILDYPSASNFLSLFQCGNSQSLTRLCDPTVDREIRRAEQAENTNPERAGALWAAVDHRVVDLAAQVDLVNPSGIDFVSNRVGNYQHNPEWGILLDQVWVR
jgi:YVTN family beta-propeller protein